MMNSPLHSLHSPEYSPASRHYNAWPTGQEGNTNKPGPERANIEEALSKFESYGLADLDKANLMNRVDVKFILPISFLSSLLTHLVKDYRVLDINNRRISRYHNEYYDTADFDFYHDHHNGKLNRYKVRQRTYLDTDTRFLEVKFKNNRRRTIKTRINCSKDIGATSHRNAFIEQQTGITLNTLKVIQQSGYQRIALANEASAERLTLDFDLWYLSSTCDKEREDKIKMPHFFIAELKQQKRSKLSPFFQLMSQNMIFPASFSKYCIGCALLYPNALKTNQFKSTLRQMLTFSSSHNLTTL